MELLPRIDFSSFSDKSTVNSPIETRDRVEQLLMKEKQEDSAIYKKVKKTKPVSKTKKRK